jgi:hypothetical protein
MSSSREKESEVLSDEELDLNSSDKPQIDDTITDFHVNGEPLHHREERFMAPSKPNLPNTIPLNEPVNVTVKEFNGTNTTTQNIVVEDDDAELNLRASSAFSIYSDKSSRSWNKPSAAEGLSDYASAYKSSHGKPFTGEKILKVMDEVLGNIGEYDEELNTELAHKIKSKLQRVKIEMYEELKKNGMQVQLMKGQLERRGSMMDKQRESFLKELTILREEVFINKVIAYGSL